MTVASSSSSVSGKEESGARENHAGGERKEKEKEKGKKKVERQNSGSYQKPLPAPPQYDLRRTKYLFPFFFIDDRLGQTRSSGDAEPVAHRTNNITCQQFY
jgi:hypothetical protein